MQEAGGGRCAAICQPWPFVWILSSDRGRRQNGGEGIQRPERPTMVIREERLPAAQPGRASGPNRDFVLRRLLAAADAGGIVIALAISITFFGRGGALSGILWGLVTLPAWILIFKVYGLYDRDAKRVSHSTVDDLPWLFHSLVIGSAGPLAVLRLRRAHAGRLHRRGCLLRGRARRHLRRSAPLARGSSRFDHPARARPPRRRRPDGRFSRARSVSIPSTSSIRSDTSTPSRTKRLAPLVPRTTRGRRPRSVARTASNASSSSRPRSSPDELADLIRRLRGLDVRIGILPAPRRRPRPLGRGRRRRGDHRARDRRRRR